MAFGFLPKEIQFFELFEQLVDKINLAARTFSEIAEKGNFTEDGIAVMRDLEHDCDHITHDIIDKLNRTFITPFDREDIHSLAQELDNVVDMLYTISKRLKLYKLTKVNKDLIEFAGVVEQSVNALAVAIKGLRTHKITKPINDACIEINRL